MTPRIPPLRPGRRIEGISALLLPFTPGGRPDVAAFEALVEGTFRAGLIPAVNMDTGFVHLLTAVERRLVLEAAARVAAGRPFVASAFIDGEAGDPALLYRRRVEEVRREGGTPILFPSSALAGVDEAALLAVYAETAREGAPLLAFELGARFVSFGRIFSEELFSRLLDLGAFVGLKHSSLDRGEEWRRLRTRDERRTDFRLYTGNDLAIDMAFYGSDYLLGLSAFWPEAFAARDRLWADTDPRAMALNDLLQYLGFLSFRDPLPAYRHSAAQFLRLRGVLETDAVHPRSPRRPEADVALLAEVAARIEGFLEGLR